MRVSFDNVADAREVAEKHTAAMAGVVHVYEVVDDKEEKTYVAASAVEYVHGGTLLASYENGQEN